MGKIIYNGIDCGGGGSGTSIEPNPSGAATDTLEKLDIDGTIYDFEGTTYTAGTNIQIVNDVISATDTTYTAGTNIQITNNEISATDTTYSAFQGTDGTEAGSSGLVPAPAASDTNKYLKSDGTWATVSGGGGSGNVDDVYVNGTSVLDANHIAQVTSYKELTQAQYDALPASKYTDGVLYCIKDTGINEGDKFTPIIYSTDEREIGTWLDGKPLYQKSFLLNFNVTGTSRTWYNVIPAATMVSLSIEKLVGNNGSYIHIGESYLPLSYSSMVGTTGDLIGFTYDGVNEGISLCMYGFSAGTAATGCITIQYTKTTDTPGSGNWTTSGVPAVHYSTDEQVIGTWIDGKPIYQKTYEITQVTVVPNGTIIQNFDITNISKIINAVGMSTQYQQSAPLLAFIDSGNFYISSSLACSVNTITLQYTKTTD